MSNRLERVPIPTIQIKKVGDWGKAEYKLSALPLALRTSALWAQRKIAEKLVKIVKGHIDAQDLGWDPKANPDLSNDPRVLVDQGLYRNNISTWQEGYQRYIGVKKHITNTQGVPVYRYAALHEFLSYNGGPYRALWGPSIEELGGTSGMSSEMSRVINNKMRSLGL
jgi:hypothetical protein